MPKDGEQTPASQPEIKLKDPPFVAMTTEEYQEKFKHERKDALLAQVKRVLGTTLHEVNHDKLEQLVGLRKEVHYLDGLK